MKMTKLLQYLFLFPFVLLGFFTFSQTTVTEVFNTPGLTSWTAPCGVGSVTIHVYGAGGGGGGSTVNNGQGGGGGGSGAYGTVTFFATGGTTYNLLVGTGGTGSWNAGLGVQNPNFPGQNGTQTYFDTPGPGVVAAPGGQGGGDANFSLGYGGNGGAAPPAWAGGIAGGNGTAGIVCFGGGGGTAPGPSGGGGGAGAGGGAPGGNGGDYGAGGGGGGCRQTGNNTLGGNGADGAVVIVYDLSYNLPLAGLDQNVCGAVNMTGNAPSTDWTGTWSVIAGSANIVSPNDPNTSVSVLVAGTCATLRWTFTHDFDASCAPVFDDVEICFPLLCNDDPCGAIALTVNSGPCLYQTENNSNATASTSMIEPGCGDWSDNDAWYTAVVPANGSVTINTQDYGGAPPGATMVMGMAVYYGPDCNNLTHAGCDAAGASTTPAEITYTGTPGETIWIRVWDTTEDESNFDICAFTHTNVQGDVLPGATTVTCGGPSLSFFDPGGDGGNYDDNTTAYYELCPDTPGQFVTVDFSTGPLFFDTEIGWDVLTVLDGASDSSFMIGQYSGSGASAPTTITSSAADGCLTFIFNADMLNTDFGWEAAVSCAAVAGVNDSTCTATDCTGECGTWICATGLYPAENIGNNFEDISLGNGGCFDNNGEVATNWFYFTALTTGNVEFSFAGPGGQDYNFAVFGPSTNGRPPCPQNTDLPPVACSQADVGNYSIGGLTGMSSVLGAGEQYEGAEGDGWIDALPVVAGETYAMVVNIYQNGGPQPVIDMTIGGTGTLDCTPVYLPIELLSFDGINQGAKNLLSWTTASELNNDFFTLERSVNGFDWELVGHVDGAGTTQHRRFYQLYDNNPYFPVTYYRLKQTDFDGQFKYFDVISLSNDKQFEGDVVSELFPNPATTYATFTYTGKETSLPLNVKVINSIGKTVSNTDYENLQKGAPMTLRLDDLSSGIYQVVFSQGDKTVLKKLSIL